MAKNDHSREHGELTQAKSDHARRLGLIEGDMASLQRVSANQVTLAAVHTEQIGLLLKIVYGGLAAILLAVAAAGMSQILKKPAQAAGVSAEAGK